MMMGAKKRGAPAAAGRGKRPCDRGSATAPGRQQPPLRASPPAQMQDVATARSEMTAMGFDAAATERALRLHSTLPLHSTHARVDLAAAVASCVSLSEAASSRLAAEPAEAPRKVPRAIGSPSISDCALAEPPTALAAERGQLPPQEDAGSRPDVEVASHYGPTAPPPGSQPSARAPQTAPTRGPSATGNLCAFLGVPDRSAPRFFFLDWDARTAVFLHDRPSQARDVASVNWRQAGRQVTLCTAGPVAKSWEPPPPVSVLGGVTSTPTRWHTGHEQLLKSLLQVRPKSPTSHIKERIIRNEPL